MLPHSTQHRVAVPGLQRRSPWPALGHPAPPAGGSVYRRRGREVWAGRARFSRSRRTRLSPGWSGICSPHGRSSQILRRVYEARVPRVTDTSAFKIGETGFLICAGAVPARTQPLGRAPAFSGGWVACPPGMRTSTKGVRLLQNAQLRALRLALAPWGRTLL